MKYWYISTVLKVGHSDNILKAKVRNSKHIKGKWGKTAAHNSLGVNESKNVKCSRKFFEVYLIVE